MTDINYELMQLALQNGVGQEAIMPAALGQLLRPAGYSPEPLDHLLSWHLLTLLKAIGAIITSPATAEKVRFGVEFVFCAEIFWEPLLQAILWPSNNIESNKIPLAFYFALSSQG